jgi:hypothetical protein
MEKGPENSASRSGMRNRSGCARSSRSKVKFLACCVTQALAGLVVQPARWTRFDASPPQANSSRCERGSFFGSRGNAPSALGSRRAGAARNAQSERKPRWRRRPCPPRPSRGPHRGSPRDDPRTRPSRPPFRVFERRTELDLCLSERTNLPDRGIDSEDVRCPSYR